MTIEQGLALARVLGLIDLGEARTYLDEEGQIEAILVMTDVQESEVATSPGFPNLYGEGEYLTFSDLEWQTKSKREETIV